MSKLANPFTYGGPVDTKQFIGRTNELNRVFDQLTNQAHGSVAIIGERRVGKTSLLHYVAAPDVMKRWNLAEEQSIFIFQDCGAIAPFSLTRFWQTILRRLLHLLKRKFPYAPLPDSIQALLGATEITVLDIEFLLDEFYEHNLLLILMLDEFEALVRTDIENEAITRDFLAGLRALINHVPRTLSVIVSTRQPLDKVCKEVRFMGSPFYNNFVFVHLRPFNRTEAELLFDQMLANTGISFDQTEKDYIYNLAGTHPLLLQAVASLIFELKVDSMAEIRDFGAVREQFCELVEHQFEDFWKWSQPRERQILTQLANGEEEANTRLQAWADERETLLRRGLITKDKDGGYRIFSSVFWQWLIANLYRLGEIRPPDSPEINDLKQQLLAYQRRLAVLQLQEAKLGLQAPPYLTIDIEDTQAKIESLRARIAQKQD
ncbi:MAG: ATP-binding protein [Anaerolineales bacterium]|nr:ATP-binding protein [Anaerolineales bacterium]